MSNQQGDNSSVRLPSLASLSQPGGEQRSASPFGQPPNPYQLPPNQSRSPLFPNGSSYPPMSTSYNSTGGGAYSNSNSNNNAFPLAGPSGLNGSQSPSLDSPGKNSPVTGRQDTPEGGQPVKKAPKKRKSTAKDQGEGDGEDDDEKKKRAKTPRACDSCRTKKVRSVTFLMLCCGSELAADPLHMVPPLLTFQVRCYPRY